MEYYRLPRVQQKLVELEVTHLPPAQLATMASLGKTELVQLRREWIEEVKAGQAPGMKPLSKNTVRQRERRGVKRQTPLYDTGALMRSVAEWPIEIETEEFADEKITTVRSGPGASQDQSCIAKDMLMGNPAVGRGKKTAIPARPIQINDKQLAGTERRFEHALEQDHRDERVAIQVVENQNPALLGPGGAIEPPPYGWERMPYGPALGVGSAALASSPRLLSSHELYRSAITRSARFTST